MGAGTGARSRLLLKREETMDVKVFYQKLRKIEQGIADEHVVLVSHETPDGGQAGLKTEVSREVAARMIAEGRARLAELDESTEYRERTAEAQREAERRAAAERVQVKVIAHADIHPVKKARR